MLSQDLLFLHNVSLTIFRYVSISSGRAIVLTNIFVELGAFYEVFVLYNSM